MMLNSLSRVADDRRDGDVLDVGLVVQALERGLRARARTSSVMSIRFVQVASRAPRSRRSGLADGCSWAQPGLECGHRGAPAMETEYDVLIEAAEVRPDNLDAGNCLTKDAVSKILTVCERQ
jgi:hypothetical protein